MIQSPRRLRLTTLEIGQPFNPFRFFTGIFIPEGLVRSKLVSLKAKVAYGRLTRYAGQDGKCFPAVGTLAREIGVGERQAQKYLGDIEDLKVEGAEPVFDPPPLVLRDVKLDSDEGPRPELASEDFVVAEEIVPLMRRLNEMPRGVLRRVEVRAGIPRRIMIESRLVSASERFTP